MKIKKDDTIAFLLFTLNPVAAILYTLFKMKEKETFLRIILCLSLALFAYRFTPFIGMDLTRYYNVYNNVQHINYSNITDYYQYNLPIIYFIKTLNVIGINKEFLPFFSVWISYFFSFSAISFIHTKNVNKSYRYIYICLFLTIQILASISGLRNGMATSIFFYSISHYFFGNKKTSYFFMMLSCFVHSYIILPVALVIFNEYVFRYFKLYKTLLFIIIVIAYSGLSFYIIDSVVTYFPSEIAGYIKSNFIDNKIVGFGVDKSIIQIIVNNIILSSQFYVLLFLIYITKSKDVINKKLHSYIILICYVVTMLNGFDIIQLRYMYLFNLLSIVYFVNLKHVARYSYLCFFSSGAISFIWSLFFIKLSIIRAGDYIYLPSILNFFYTINLNELINI